MSDTECCDCKDLNDFRACDYVHFAAKSESQSTTKISHFKKVCLTILIFFWFSDRSLQWQHESQNCCNQDSHQVWDMRTFATLQIWEMNKSLSSQKMICWKTRWETAVMRWNVWFWSKLIYHLLQWWDFYVHVLWCLIISVSWELSADTYLTKASQTIILKNISVSWKWWHIWCFVSHKIAHKAASQIQNARSE